MTRPLLALLFLIAATPAAAGTLTLSPAVVPLGGRPGQSAQQHLTVFNGTDQPMQFRIVAKDVLIRDGKREFSAAGTHANSIAATAVFSATTITVPANAEGAVDVTLTLPPQVTHRAVVILFQGTVPGSRTNVAIGSLLTFELTGHVSVRADAVHATPPTDAANAEVTLALANDGSEPAVVRIVSAILTAKGTLVGKLPFEPRRLLPGEQSTVAAQYAGDLPAGDYRVITTLDVGRRTVTRTTALHVP